MMDRLRHAWWVLIVACCMGVLMGCQSSVDKMRALGRVPEFSDIRYPNRSASDMLDAESQGGRPAANSLWQASSGAFFRDQRARRVGDIVKVIVNVSDSASLNNQSQHGRTTKDNLPMPTVMGFEKILQGKLLPGGADSATLLNIGGSNSVSGSGTIKRNEKVTTQIAATVVRILPNGHLAIRGSQEIRVNYELREITLQGIVRPQDISAENEVQLDQIAEARISYGGRGHVSNVQEPRVGHQLIEALSPF
jgi:flagellar L-ring protein precursor FlgH